MGLVARVVEAEGIPTVVVSTGRDLTELVRPPRSLFRNAPMGNPFGRPHHPDQQRRILRDALRLTETVTEGGTIVDHPEPWDEPFDDKVRATLVGMAG